MIVGGASNTNLAGGGFIGGGYNNLINSIAEQGTIGGGYYNTVGAGGGTVPGGQGNRAMGEFSLAAGFQANALHDGAFVWADSSSAAAFPSTRADQFRVRARGGMEVVGSGGVEAFKFSGSRAGDFSSPVAYGENSNVSGNSAPALRLVNNGGNAVQGVLSVSSLGIGNLASFGNASAFVAWLTTNGTWNALAYNGTSDRAVKENFTAVNPRDVLDKVATLPLTRWNYKEAPGLDHIGPVAQDFHAAFGLNGSDDKHIATVDADGVALAAIQGLNQKLEAGSQEAGARIQRLEGELQQKELELAELKARLERLEQLLK